MTREQYNHIKANGTYDCEIGTMTRGNGSKMHTGYRGWYELNGQRTPAQMGSSCNGNPRSRTGNHWNFEEGFDRKVTCETCKKDGLMQRIQGETR